MSNLERLERLKNYRTRYELAAIRGDQKILISYTSRPNRRGIWDSLYARAAAVVALTGVDIAKPAGKSSKGLIMGDWSIRFTGRTQREAIIGGELPYVGTIQQAEVF